VSAAVLLYVRLQHSMQGNMSSSWRASTKVPSPGNLCAGCCFFGICGAGPYTSQVVALLLLPPLSSAVALLTDKIRDMSSHFITHRKDYHSMR
jgi:ribosomal protein S15P/S13E